MIDERDELIERVSHVLSPLPQVRSGAMARLLMAVRASQARPVTRWRRAVRWVEETWVPARVAGLLVAASLVIGFAVRGTFARAGDLTGAKGTVLVIQPAGYASAALRPVPVALVLQLANAKSVSVVGDFNGWDPEAAPMERFGGSGAWSATLLASPGRHTYGFLVDGTTLMADPRAPRTRSTDFGGDASVMIVRTP